jgi:arylformamidase
VTDAEPPVSAEDPPAGVRQARFIDLSHELVAGMDGYPGLPAPRIDAHLTHEASRPRYDDRAAFYIGHVDMVGNTGTYLDSPFHRYPDAPDLAALPLDRLAGIPGTVLDAPATAGPVDPACADALLRGRAVLVRTGWDGRWGSPAYWEPGPYLAPTFLDRLLAAEAVLVGVDFWNVDDTSDPARPAHTRLLAAGVLIVEHLAHLERLPAQGFRFFAVPPAIRAGASFPVRAFAELR